MPYAQCANDMSWVPFHSNHGSFYYSQLAALQILVNDTASANATIQKYFSTLYKNQINATGEQVRAVPRDNRCPHPLTCKHSLWRQCARAPTTTAHITSPR